VESPLALESRRVAGLPLVNAVLDRLGLDQLLSGTVPDRGRLPAARSLGVLLRNIALHDRQPVYTLAEWASAVEPSLLGIQTGDAAALNDDRVGRALDRLVERIAYPVERPPPWRDHAPPGTNGLPRRPAPRRQPRCRATNRVRWLHGRRHLLGCAPRGLHGGPP